MGTMWLDRKPRGKSSKMTLPIVIGQRSPSVALRLIILLSLLTSRTLISAYVSPQEAEDFRLVNSTMNTNCSCLSEQFDTNSTSSNVSARLLG